MKRILGAVAAAVMLVGWGLPAYAMYASPCDNANCWIRIDEANDPAYQAAIHRGPYSSPYYSSPSYYGYQPYSYYPYSYTYPYNNGYLYQNQYQYQYQYQYQQSSNVSSYSQNNCLYVVKIENGLQQTTTTCVR